MVEVLNFNEKWEKSLGEAMKILDVNAKIQVGILTIPPHARLPENGFSIHKEHHEFAYVIEGEVTLVTDKGEFPAKNGEFVYNEPNTPHYTVNKTEKPAKVLWMLVEV
ncbi:cupin domain-containing protein [Thermococcus sp.]